MLWKTVRRYGLGGVGVKCVHREAGRRKHRNFGDSMVWMAVRRYMQRDFGRGGSECVEGKQGHDGVKGRGGRWGDMLQGPGRKGGGA